MSESRSELNDETRVEAYKEDHWREQDQLTNNLTDSGAEKFFDSENMPELPKSFLEGKGCCCCIDEGTVHRDNQTDNFFLAGSGILFPADSYDERLIAVAELLLKKEVGAITSHDGCGAGGIAWKKLTEGERNELEQEGIEDSDQYAKKWAKDLQAKMNELKSDETEEVDYDHISAADMSRRSEFHNARVTYFDLTGKFNPRKLGEKVPYGFVIDHGDIVSDTSEENIKKYPFAELDVTFNIAFGDHGFGEKFTETSPFVVVVVSGSAEELKEAEEKIKGLLPAEHKDKIKVDGFVFEG